MEQNERRIFEVEHTVADHSRRIKTVESRIALLHNDLTGVKTVLMNIKWWIVGVGTFYMAQQVGLMPLLKKLVGI